MSKPQAPIKLTPESARLAVLQLSVMLNSGVPITRAIEALMKSDDPTLKDFGESVLRSISGGYYLSQALQRATDSFTKAQISLLSTGEKTGRLALVLRRLSEQMEREDNFRRQLGSALIYPTGILIVTGLMALFMMNFMLPQLLEAVGTL
ncbi:MAG: type II secretion system F family protein, partial [Candidatus Eremiobacteraeota bacterium]|nr:type II secretion system F family protein [Candidatus Eremiobacteraeota bacterium]